MTDYQVGVLGATSLVGECLRHQLAQVGYGITAYSRHAVTQVEDGVKWLQLPISHPPTVDILAKKDDSLPLWICVAPIWVLPEHFALLEAHGAQRVVALSSTSRFSKDKSSDPEEQAVARRLADAEARVREWAEKRGIEWVIIRPTLIYGLGRDKNIAEIAHFIRRLGFFPLLGKANGLRQPIHAEDVAAACSAALQAPCATNRAYNISGGETLTYRDMVARIFTALDRRPYLLTVPLWFFRLAVAILRCLPRYRRWSTAMAERMSSNLVFDHTEAEQDLGFKPRTFMLSTEDLPK
ncbi:MAG: NAD-dependent epimerase/dehydratase family protein [Methylobacter sp.]|nr:MAG: NAD-dependent epimerase/dehydratase family protein [Methylobacter sp.]